MCAYCGREEEVGRLKQILGGFLWVIGIKRSRQGPKSACSLGMSLSFQFSLDLAEWGSKEMQTVFVSEPQKLFAPSVVVADLVTMMRDIGKLDILALCLEARIGFLQCTQKAICDLHYSRVLYWWANISIVRTKTT